MARNRSKKQQQTPQPRQVRRGIWIMALAFLLVEVVVLPGAASPFRSPKEVLALITLLLVVGLSLAGQLWRGRLELRWSPVATVLAALPLLQALSALWSGSGRLAITAAVQSAIWIAGALWLATVSSRERLRVADGAAVGAAVSGVVLMAQATGQAVLSLGPTGPSGRLVLTGLTGNPADMSMAAVLLLPLVLAPAAGSDRPWFRWTLALLLTAAAVISQTLTGLVALALVWTTWLVQQRSRRLWTGAAVTAVVLVAVGMATGLGTRIERQSNRLRQGDWYFLLSARSDGWSAAAEMVRSQPVTGTGASNFTHAYYPSRIAWLDRHDSVGRRAELATHFRYAHCDPLQMVAELGLPGALWMIAFAVVAIRHRPRGDPLTPMAVAAFAPFALLHFPTHLAVGLMPLILVLGHGLSGARTVVIEPGRWLRRLGALATVVVIVIGGYWQVHRLVLNLWRGGLANALEAVRTLDPERRAQQAASIEAQIVPRIPALPGARPWLWRMAGQARMARGDDVGAETAFRTAMALWPHEEAEFGVGLALAAQDRRLRAQGRALDDRNRRGEAIVHLSRVCRTNPALLELIDDEELRRSVAEIVSAAEVRGAPESG